MIYTYSFYKNVTQSPLDPQVMRQTPPLYFKWAVCAPPQPALRFQCPPWWSRPSQRPWDQWGMIWSYIFWTAPTRCPGKALVEAWEKIKFLSSGGFQKWRFLNSWIVDHGTPPSKMEELGIFGVSLFQ